MNMTTITTDGQARNTGPYMHRMVERYRNDMLPYVHLSLPEVFDLVKAVPFQEDPPDRELLQRPYLTMNHLGYGGDCDDKAICMACYARLVGTPYRFVAVRRADRNSLHHVFTELYIGNKWIHADATYPFNTLGCERERYSEYVII